MDLGLTAVFSELGNVPEFLTNLSFNGNITINDTTNTADEQSYTKLSFNGDDTTEEPSYTFFAPSNEAFDALSDLERPSSQTILGGYIINGSAPILTNRFQQGQILTPIDNQYSLHVTTADRVRMEQY